MPKKVVEATDALVRNIKTVGVRAVGGVDGLCLRVSPRQSDIEARRAALKEGRPVPTPAPHSADDPLPRSWVLRVPIHGKRQDIGLGSYPSVTLAAAREAARAIRAKVTAGVDPMAERREAKRAAAAAVAKAVTFEQVAEDWWLKKKVPTLTGKKSDQPIRDMRRLAFPILGHLVVSEVQTAHVTAVLDHDKLWTTRTPTATKLRGNLEQVLAYATAKGLRSGENPARWRGHLDQVYASPKKVHRGKNQPALPVEQLPPFMAELRSAAGDAARALEVAILCASRSQEVRGMTWAEVDLDAARWTIPGERMKMRRPHAVPLSARVVELLRAQAEKKPDDVDLVFPAGESNTELSDMTLLAVIKRMNQRRKAAGEPLWVDPAQGGRPVVPHGFRATFRVWARAQRFADDAAEAALAHAEENETIAAYKRTDHFKERVPMMKAWADYCAGKA